MVAFAVWKGDKGCGKDDAPKDKSKVVCWYCGKAGHYQEDCRQKIADDKKRHPKGDSGKGKDKGDRGKTGREKPDPKGKGKGKDSKGKGKGKGKDKGKKDKRVRAVGEGSVDQEEPEGECLMALREGELIPTGVLRTTTPTPAEHQVRLVGVEQQDAYWLVDSGATSHCMSFSCFEKYDVLRTYDHKPTLSNASNETIEVMKVCDVRVRFGKQVVVLEHCLITNLDFNVLSPFVAWQRGWHTMLTNSPHIYNKKNKKRIRLTVKDRAWYAVATLKDGGDQMELDVVQQKPPAAAQAKSKPEKPEAKPKARSASQKPETSKPNKATKAQRAAEQRALESVKSLEYTPFKFLLRSLRTTRVQGSLCQDSETQGSRMKAVPSEVAPREHQEMAWLFAVLCLNMVGMLAVCVRVARSVCACKVSGLSFPGGFSQRLQGICDSVRGKEASECRCGFKPKVKRKVFRRGGSIWCLLVFLLLVPYGASGSASNDCSDHSSEGVLADYPTKAELSGYSAEGVCAQDTAEGGFRYGERLGNVAFEATSVFSFSEKGSQWESCSALVPTASGKATMGQASVPATGGKAAPRVPRVSVRPVFSHPPLPKEKQAKLEQSRASFTQRVSEARAKAAGQVRRRDRPRRPRHRIWVQSQNNNGNSKNTNSVCKFTMERWQLFVSLRGTGAKVWCGQQGSMLRRLWPKLVCQIRRTSRSPSVRIPLSGGAPGCVQRRLSKKSAGYR